jgi:signal transduction histidine kinase
VHVKTHDLDTATGHQLVRGIRNVILVGGLWTVGLFTLARPEPPEDFGRPLLAAVFLFCAWAAYRLVSRYVRAERERQARVAERARLDGVALGLRSVRHHLGNRLAAAAGYSEMLADDPRLPDDLEEQAEKIRRNALAAVNTVDKLQRGITRVQLDASVAGPLLLDVDGSIAGPDPN